tara:strand:- start:9470 stop:9802 length:333 start_codon:yes stop_codon:yes gene_type:complete
MNRPVTDAELAEYLVKVQDIVDRGLVAFHGEGFLKTFGYVISAQPGRKYIKIVKTDKDGSGRSVHHFVNRETGDILKAASWKKPAKGIRGNIRQPNLEMSLRTHGAVYWK